VSTTGGRAVRTVLLDLDGTFADTAPDLLGALNRLRNARGLTPAPVQRILPWISLGTAAILREGIQIAETDAEFGTLQNRYLDLYESCVGQRTRPFPGMIELLQALGDRCVGWGIVTNKPARFTDRLMRQISLPYPPACVVSGDTVARGKPHPDPLLHGCAQAGCPAEQCVYVGDAASDVLAAQRAGMPALVALFGYIPADEQPARWGADGLVSSPLEILEWIDTPANTAGTR